MQANESFSVSYRNGAVYANGMSNSLGSASFVFNSLLIGRYILDIVTTSGKRASVTFTVNAVGTPPAAQPCSIKQVKPSTPFTSGIIFGAPTTQSYDVAIVPGNATVITTTMFVNNQLIKIDRVDAQSRDILQTHFDVQYNQISSLKLGPNEVKFAVRGNNGCTNENSYSVFSFSMPPWLSLITKNGLEGEAELEIPPHTWQKF